MKTAFDKNQFLLVILGKQRYKAEKPAARKQCNGPKKK